MILPYRGLGSGIKRALDAWPKIDFIDDRDGCPAWRSGESVGESVGENSGCILTGRENRGSKLEQ
jgi:hypothetical protein